MKDTILILTFILFLPLIIVFALIYFIWAVFTGEDLTHGFTKSGKTKEFERKEV